MKRLKTLVALGAVAVTIGAAAQPAAAQSDRVLIISDCVKAQFEPKRVVVSCADGNFFIGGIDWTSWGANTASGDGTARVNDCEPDCADGKLRSYPVEVRAFRPRHQSACSSRSVFTRLELRFPGARPEGQPRTSVVKVSCFA